MSLREPCRAHFSVVAGAWSPAPWEVLTAAASAGAESSGWPCKLAVVSRVWRVGGGVGTGGTVPQPRVGGRSRAPRLGCAGSLCHPAQPPGRPTLWSSVGVRSPPGFTSHFSYVEWG